jgi:hypothetical protein
MAADIFGDGEMVERFEEAPPRVLVFLDPRIEPLNEVERVVVEARPDMQAVLVGAVVAIRVSSTRRLATEPPAERINCNLVSQSIWVLLR